MEPGAESKSAGLSSDAESHAQSRVIMNSEYAKRDFWDARFKE
jgi:hypothetical protein